MKKIINFFNFYKKEKEEELHKNEKQDLIFSNACNLIRKQREIHNLSRKQLALKTKVSIFVIEALENGWLDQLPEKTFLKKMLLIIEVELSLPENSLIEILHKANGPIRNKPKKFLSPGSIDIFSSWQGNFIYFCLIFFSIIALNKQQENLFKLNSIQISPLEFDSNIKENLDLEDLSNSIN
tara:strand:+ start:33546 stop:34091 length:546 start_codon:yes stop_codon:yes gene_type:complete